jgi:hypothetical protein
MSGMSIVARDSFFSEDDWDVQAEGNSQVTASFFKDPVEYKSSQGETKRIKKFKIIEEEDYSLLVYCAM